MAIFLYNTLWSLNPFIKLFLSWKSNRISCVVIFFVQCRYYSYTSGLSNSLTNFYLSMIEYCDSMVFTFHCIYRREPRRGSSTYCTDKRTIWSRDRNRVATFKRSKTKWLFLLRQPASTSNACRRLIYIHLAERYDILCKINLYMENISFRRENWLVIDTKLLEYFQRA